MFGDVPGTFNGFVHHKKNKFKFLLPTQDSLKVCCTVRLQDVPTTTYTGPPHVRNFQYETCVSCCKDVSFGFTNLDRVVIFVSKQQHLQSFVFHKLQKLQILLFLRRALFIKLTCIPETIINMRISRKKSQWRVMKISAPTSSSHLYGHRTWVILFIRIGV